MNKTKAREFQKLLISARTQLGDMTIQKLNVLLEVYIEEEIDQSTLVNYAELTRSSASKNIAAWTDLDAYKKRGPGFIRSTPDPMNLKTRILEITDRGRTAVNTVLE